MPLLSLLDRLGYSGPLRRHGRQLAGPCPFDGRGERAFVVDEKSNSFYCFACDEGGGPIQLVALYYRTSGDDAVDRIERWFGPFPYQPQHERKRRMSGSRPSHKVLAITEREISRNNIKSFFTPIGKAWPTRDQKGLSIVLDALPVSGRLLVLEFTEEDEKPAMAESTVE